MPKKIWGQTIVKNEDRYIYFAIKSVIDFLDKLIIWDTGSTDKTVKIIKKLQLQFLKKIEFKELGPQNPSGITTLRQQMLNISDCDWIIILDGDEVWWKDSIKKIKATINKNSDELFALVNPTINLIGDMYHYQEEKAGQYFILGKIGHFNIRAINRRIPGLHIKGDYPKEAFYGENENMIQSMDQKLKFVDAPYLHFTHLPRSTENKNMKLKYELGIRFPKNFKYPEVFYEKYPGFIPNPFTKRTKEYILRAFIETPLKKLKRRFR